MGKANDGARCIKSKTSRSKFHTKCQNIRLNGDHRGGGDGDCLLQRSEHAVGELLLVGEPNKRPQEEVDIQLCSFENEE